MATPIERLNAAWSRPSGFVGWMMAVNHRAVGLRYIITAFVFFLLAGILALLMRLQLAWPMLDVLSPDAFNQFFTMHGATMMFLFAVPMLEGLGIYFIPLMIGARDMAFPRLNAFGYWTYLFGGTILYAAFFLGHGPNAGWFNYTPLGGPGFSPTLTAIADPGVGAPFRGGAGIDFYLIALTLLEVAALVVAVEMIVTIFKLRAPGMAVHRMPLFVWAALVTAFMIIFAMPVLATASILLEFDRKFGTHFFNVAAGGSSFLWQHLFWFFGHPDVYIMLLPAFGIVSTVIAAAMGRPIAGYLVIAMTLVAIGFISFGLWVHHMYAGGFALLGLSFFAAASMMIAIPSGLQIFAWIATIWRGRFNMSTAFLFALGTILVFVLGGITGVMVASPAFNWQVHDTYFIVAHFHYVLIGGVVLPIFAGLYHWLPKISGRLLSERLGKWNFWLMFLGTNLTFFPMHQLGFEGMPRRVYTFLPDLGLDELNLLATVGAFMLGLGVLVFLINVVVMLRGQEAGDNPWKAGTLEWATSSPPAQYNFATIPVVRSRYPLWEQDGLAPRDERKPRGWDDFSDTPHGNRETYVTTLLEGLPQAKALLPAPSLLPFWLAFAVTLIFVGFLPILGFDVELWLIPVGLLLTYILALAWVWPHDGGRTAAATATVGEPGELPHLVSGSRSTVWWGMIWFLVIDAVVLGTLIFTYFYLRVGVMDWPALGIDPPEWPRGGIAPPGLLLPAVAGPLLLASAAAMFWSSRAARREDHRRLFLGLLLAMALAAAGLAVSIADYIGWGYGWTANAYASVTWVLGGFHGAHVLSLLLIGAPMAILARRNYFGGGRYMPVQAVAMYWYYVVAAWVPVYATLYVAPYVF